MSGRLLSTFTVYRDPAYYCGPGPAVIHDPDTGRLTVAFRRVHAWLEDGLAGHWHPATESCLTHSTDDGSIWTAPRVFLAGMQCPNLRRLRDGAWAHHTHRFELVSQSLFEAIRAGHPDAGGLRGAGPWPGVSAGTGIWRSADGGVTWGAPTRLAGVPGVVPVHPNLGVPLAVRGNLLETSAGRLLVSAYTLDAVNVSHLFASDDGGRHWRRTGSIAAGANETCLHETAKGRLLAFLRSQSGEVGLVRCVSDDGGCTWSDPEPVCRGFPAITASLPSGRILLVYGWRQGPGYGVRARVLAADGADAGEDELVLWDEGACADLGYPDAAVLADGRVVVVAYLNTRADLAEGADAAAARVPRFVGGFVVQAD